MAQGFPGAIASDRGSSRGNISGDSGPNRKAKGRFVLKLRTLLSLSLVLTPLWGLAPVADAMAQEELQQGPNTLVLQYRAVWTDRHAFRAHLETAFAAKLRAMKAQGVLAAFRIFSAGRAAGRETGCQ